jgi:WhiB family redox-sensing transcriptional regulator
VNGAWVESAACRGEDPVLFFGPDGERQPEREIRERKAKSVCMRCPVRAACLESALESRDQYGIFGGMTEDERAKLRRRQMRRANAA